MMQGYKFVSFRKYRSLYRLVTDCGGDLTCVKGELGMGAYLKGDDERTCILCTYHKKDKIFYLINKEFFGE